MEEIIAPVPKELLKAELTEEKRLRFTHRSNNEIYINIGQCRPLTFNEYVVLYKHFTAIIKSILDII